MSALEELLNAAKAHGELSEPDHEVGDLQDILRSCWKVMTKEQRKKVYDEHDQKIEDWCLE